MNQAFGGIMIPLAAADAEADAVGRKPCSGGAVNRFSGGGQPSSGDPDCDHWPALRADAGQWLTSFLPGFQAELISHGTDSIRQVISAL